MATTNVATKSSGTPSEITWMQDKFLPMLENQLNVGNSGKYDDYGKQCALSGIDSIFQLIHESGVTATELNSSNVKSLLSVLALYHINPASDITGGRECFFKIRNVNVGDKKNPKWEKKIELELETDGLLAMVARSGRNVKTVHPKWVVREHDKFEFPKHHGVEVTPAEWEPVPNAGKVILVCIPIEYNDGHVEYHTSEREDCRANLVGHIKNNLMNQTFGIAKSRYDATPDQLKQIEEKKNAILEVMKKCETFDDMLKAPELTPYISAAWSDSTESMLVTKMIKNIVKKIPKETAGVYSQQVTGGASVITDDESAVVADVEYQEVVSDVPVNAHNSTAESMAKPNGKIHRTSAVNPATASADAPY